MIKKIPIGLTAAVLFALAVCSVWGEELQKVSHNPWELIIYRPENSAQINEERCWLTLRDDKGSEIKVSAQNYPNGISATYEWISNPNVINKYGAVNLSFRRNGNAPSLTARKIHNYFFYTKRKAAQQNNQRKRKLDFE